MRSAEPARSGKRFGNWPLTPGTFIGFRDSRSCSSCCGLARVALATFTPEIAWLWVYRPPTAPTKPCARLIADWGYTMFMKKACRLLINWFSVPSAPLIARNAGPIVLAIAVPILLIAATMAAQSIPNCALTGWGAINDTINTKTKSTLRCSHNAAKKFHFGSILLPPLLE